MNKRNPDKSPGAKKDGFTLVEIVAVLTILGVVGSIAVGKVVALDSSAIQTSFNWSVNELNGREHLAWSKVKISDTNWVDDLLLYAEIDYHLGRDYTWKTRTPEGGTLSFKGQQIAVARLPSTASHPGSWRIK